jgi:hypothetical protein
MDTQPEPPSDPGGDTLPEFPALADCAKSDVGRGARHARRRRAVGGVVAAGAEFAKAAPEIVLEFIEGLLP